jgi:hypothetical protein
MKRRGPLDDIKIIACYCIIDDVLRQLGHESHVLAGVSDAEVLTVAVVSALYFQNHHERALFVMKGMHYLTKPISTSRFSRRLHALAQWLEYIVEIVCSLFSTGEAFIIDSIPVPVCKRVRAARCAKIGIITIIDGKRLPPRAYYGYCTAKKEKFYGWRLHLICTREGIPVTFQMLPAGLHDLTPVHELTSQLHQGAHVYGDKAYNSGAAEAAILEHSGVHLIPKRRDDMKPNSFEEWCDLRWFRPAIETLNSQLEKMGIQRLHACTNQGLTLKVLASLLALVCTNLF